MDATFRSRQITDIQYGITIMGGREVSRPYRNWFFAEGESFLCFCFCAPSIYPLSPKTASYFWISELICTFVVLVWDSLVLFRNTGWVVSSSMGHILCAAFAALGANH